MFNALDGVEKAFGLSTLNFVPFSTKLLLKYTLIKLKNSWKSQASQLLLTNLTLLSIYLLGLCIATNYQWQSTNGKKIILWKLSSIQMKLLDDIVFTTWIQFNTIEVHWIELDPNWIQIQMKRNGM